MLAPSWSPLCGNTFDAVAHAAWSVLGNAFSNNSFTAEERDGLEGILGANAILWPTKLLMDFCSSFFDYVNRGGNHRGNITHRRCKRDFHLSCLSQNKNWRGREKERDFSLPNESNFGLWAIWQIRIFMSTSSRYDSLLLVPFCNYFPSNKMKRKIQLSFHENCQRPKLKADTR